MNLSFRPALPEQGNPRFLGSKHRIISMNYTKEAILEAHGDSTRKLRRITIMTWTQGSVRFNDSAIT
ncbi:hypothetical protein Y032_0330g2710 [Ancylostoma ceylanicum]|uniref:Uncharacterized protein n=1 Tax=Ancylostoma ceylanicum TaxID=53326 RepID=A0A016S084_9BILA|nr:hypothetical protein Y032_0330g2710 [Ancylostoma ceylanicum]